MTETTLGKKKYRGGFKTRPYNNVYVGAGLKPVPIFSHRGFNLLELLLVTIIIAILAGIAVPNYTKAREHALGREAIGNLKLIGAAERVLHLEAGNYSACGNTAACNLLLSLDVSANNWTYNVRLFPGPGGTEFEAFATRVGGTCVYRLASTFPSGEPAISGGVCP